jgi:hypothetical protein
VTATSSDRVRSPAGVRPVSLTAETCAISTLFRIDYYDAFLVEASVERSPEQWARATIEDAPLARRAWLLSGWTSLGLRLGPPWAADRVLGWKVAQSRPDFALLKADSWLGLQGELLFQRRPHGLLFATFIQQNHAVASTVWRRITPTHQAVVRSLLVQAARREASRRNGLQTATGSTTGE